MIQHLTTQHLSIVNERQISTYADMCEREIDDTELNACLICSEKMSLSRLRDHLATHMEEIALFVLPLIADDEQGNLELELQAAKDREREREAYDDFLRKQQEKEHTEEQAYLDALSTRKDKEEAEERGYRAFLHRQKENQAADGKINEEEQARLDSAIRAQMERSGRSQNDIEVNLNPDKGKKKNVTRSSDGEHFLDTTSLISPPPVFPRISRRFLDTETLEHYHVPWESDRVSILLLTTETSYRSTNLGAVKWRIHNHSQGTRQVRNGCSF
jgi:hypothetical protein